MTEIKEVPIGDIRPYERNPRRIGDKAVRAVAESIKEFGWQQPIVTDAQGVIIVGHTRYRAAQMLKLETVPVLVADLPEDKARALSLAVLNNYVEHLVTRIALNRTCSDLLIEGCVSAEEELLTGLATSIECTRYLRTAERTVSQKTAVLTSERYTLSYALVDDKVRNLSQTVNVCLASAVVTTLDGVVEKTIDRIVVVLVVLSCIDTTLCCDRVRTTGRVLDAENLHVVAEFTERSSSRSTTQTGTNDDNVELALVGGAYDLNSCLMVAPLLSQLTCRNFGI